MAKITKRRISVEVSRTVNLGDYNSVRLQFGVGGDIDDKANVEEELFKLTAETEEMMTINLFEIIENIEREKKEVNIK